MTDMVFALSESPWAHAASASLAHRPVHTLRYFEWQFTVPMLLVLAGCCALGRPLAEVVVPVAVTEVYMLIAWATLIVEGAALRWALLIATFVGYGWASRDMFRWVNAFLRSAPDGATCRRLRAASAVFLVALFGLYGVIYLLAFAGKIGSQAERVAYTGSGFGCKVVMSLLFTAIRAMEHIDTLGDMLSRISGVSSAFVSLLRGSFDFVLPCEADAYGECRFAALTGGDVAELERCLNRSLLGTSLNEHLAGELEQERFRRYVQNAVRHAELAQSHSGQGWIALAGPSAPDQGVMPPVSQVLHIKLQRTPASGLGKGSGVQPHGGPEVVSAVVHLSTVPQQSLAAGGTLRMVAGLCLAQQEPAVELVPPLPDEVANPSGPVAAHGFDRALHCTVAGSGEAVRPPAESEPMAEESVLGGSDVCSQSSKLSRAGSVTMACRQLLGPLHDHLPPQHLASKRIEEHVRCAAQTVRLRTAAKVAQLQQERDVAESWGRVQVHAIPSMLDRSYVPESGISGDVRLTHVPELDGAATRPLGPPPPSIDKFWLQASQCTHEDSEDDGETKDTESSSLAG